MTTNNNSGAVVVPTDRSLEDVEGLRGPRYLNDALTSCANPLEFITEFQRGQGIDLPTIGAAVALMDLQGCTRLTFHAKCAERLRDYFEKRVDTLSEQAKNGSDQAAAKAKLDALVKRCFRCADVPRLRPVVLHLLNRVTDLPQEYINQIVTTPGLYESCDLPVKRQIWLDRRDFFESEVQPHVRAYIGARIASMWDLKLSQGLFSVFSAQRRDERSVQQLVDMIGGEEKLYSAVKRFLRKRFVESGSGHYATLRSDLIIAVHKRFPQLEDKDAQIYKLCWCLDECVRVGQFHDRRRQEIAGIIDQLSSSKRHKSGKQKHDDGLHDAAFLLSQPNVIFTLGTMTILNLEASIRRGELPRYNALLVFGMRLLNLASSARTLLAQKKKQQAPEPESQELIQSTLANFSCALVDVQIRKLARLNNNGGGAAAGDQTDKELQCKSGRKAKVTRATDLSESLFQVVKSSPAAVVIFVHFIGHLVRLGQWKSASLCLRQLPSACDNLVLAPDTDYVLHELLTVITIGAAQASAAAQASLRIWPEHFCAALFDVLALDKVDETSEPPQSPTIAPKQARSRHLLRLLHFNFSRLTLERRDALLLEIEKAMAVVGGEEHGELDAMFALVEKRIRESVPASHRAGVGAKASSTANLLDMGILPIHLPE